MIGIKEIRQRNQRLMAAALVVGGLLAVSAVVLLAVLVISPSSETTAAATKAKPAVVEAIEGSDLSRVTLTEKAAERVSIQTAAVTEAQEVREGSSGKLAVPYSAILYDAKGNSFVYTVTGPLTYVRAPITIDYVEGDQAILSDGPSSGTEVVTLGVAELYGAETGVK